MEQKVSEIMKRLNWLERIVLFIYPFPDPQPPHITFNQAAWDAMTKDDIAEMYRNTLLVPMKTPSRELTRTENLLLYVPLAILVALALFAVLRFGVPFVAR